MSDNKFPEYCWSASPIIRTKEWRISEYKKSKANIDELKLRLKEYLYGAKVDYWRDLPELGQFDHDLPTKRNDIIEKIVQLEIDQGRIISGYCAKCNSFVSENETLCHLCRVSQSVLDQYFGDFAKTAHIQGPLTKHGIPLGTLCLSSMSDEKILAMYSECAKVQGVWENIFRYFIKWRPQQKGPEAVKDCPTCDAINNIALLEQRLRREQEEREELERKEKRFKETMMKCEACFQFFKKIPGKTGAKTGTMWQAYNTLGICPLCMEAISKVPEFKNALQVLIDSAIGAGTIKVQTNNESD